MDTTSRKTWSGYASAMIFIVAFGYIKDFPPSTYLLFVGIVGVIAVVHYFVVSKRGRAMSQLP
jgi:hypothetical protein